jgi:hypothetical protein
MTASGIQDINIKIGNITQWYCIHIHIVKVVPFVDKMHMFQCNLYVILNSDSSKDSSKHGELHNFNNGNCWKLI